MTMLEDLRKAESISANKAGCPLCIYLDTVEDQENKEALIQGSAGTIGINQLAQILRKYETGIGSRTIKRHREEEHRP